MGAIYSLQRLSRGADQYLEPIKMLLSSFVQERKAALKGSGRRSCSEKAALSWSVTTMMTGRMA
ncbi:hypothetical protein OG568_43110 [Streptomyces sp. NBC_01450]|uniref:hypothetical protein n=1 Tax=Streptomyces sp. NBC_01450 TaxID=2903871 RepID=UPI002E358ABA|nr:hypothetical protein [Streptomyces sp. NBC_01450]